MIRRGFMALAGLGLALVLAQGASAQDNRWATIFNDTGFDMITFQVAGPSDRTWGEDLLGGDNLRTGEGVSISWTGPCNNDLRAEFSNGDVRERYRVNICRGGLYHYQ